jgi:2-C-methyl-D-erythritol 4-phosphate cytidylyltransferase
MTSRISIKELLKGDLPSKSEKCTNMQKYAIIVAGGTGSRIGKEIPKQFLLLMGKPILMYSIEAFYRFDPRITIIVALHPDFFETWIQLCEQHTFGRSHQLVKGGETRCHSVQNALESITGGGMVAIHDAARPLLTQELIIRTFKEAERHLNAIPVVPVNETVRVITEGKVKLLDRSALRITQTPQVFQTDLLKKAYQLPLHQRITDDGSLLEAMGFELNLVPGDPFNLKITLPGDIEIAEIYLKNRTPFSDGP